MSEGERVAALSTVAVLVLALVKVAVGTFIGSVALLADAAHSFTDVFTSLVVFIGVRLSGREPSRRFPFGYHRAETVATLVVSVAILVTGTTLLVEASTSLGSPGVIEGHGIGLVAALGSAGVNLGLFVAKSRVGRRVNSQALVAGSRDSLSDAFASVIAFAGILGSFVGVGAADVVAGAIVAVLILRIGGMLLWDAALTMMDVGPGQEVVERVKSTVRGFPEVTNVHNVRLRRVGGRIFGELHVHVDRDLSLERAHDLSNEIEEAVRREVDTIEHVVVHFGPEGEVHEGPGPEEEHRRLEG